MATPTPVVTATPSPSVSVDPLGPRPDFIPGGSAVENKPIFDWVLGHVSMEKPKDPGKKMAKALVGVGFPKAYIELTNSKTGTGGPADAVTISVRVGTMCIIGQRMRNTAFYSSIEMAMSTGKCLIGKTREITW